MVNDRQSLDLTTFAHASGGGEVEWLISDAPVPYPEAVAAMETRVAAIAAREAPEGIWLGQQKLSGKAAESYHLPQPTDLHEAAWLVDWNGKLLKTVYTNSRNTSGMAYGNGCNPGFHGGYGLGIGHRRVGYQPFDRAAAKGVRKRRQIKALAVINHWLTITC